MMGLPAGTRIWLAAGVTDMRSGMNGLAAKVQMTLLEDPLAGHVFVFRGKRGNVVKVLWATSDGVCLLIKRLERGRFVWPQASSGKVHLTQAQLSMLLEGINWKQPERTSQNAFIKAKIKMKNSSRDEDETLILCLTYF